MTAPQFIAAASYCSALGGSTSHTLNVPTSGPGGTVLPGDLCLLIIHEAQAGAGGFPAVSGMTFTAGLYRDGTNYTPQLIYLHRVLTAGNPGAGVTVTWGSNRSWSMSLVVYRGAVNDGSWPYGNVSGVGRGTGTAVTHNSVTVTNADSLVLSHIASVTDQTAGFPTPSLFTERVDNSGASQFRNHQIADRAYGSTGSKIPGGITLGTSTTWAAQAIELLPGVEVDGHPKVWDGLAWVPAQAKVWDGSSWVPALAKVWDGSAWVLA